MTRIAVTAYMVRYPLGGLQTLVVFQKLGHDVYQVEKSDYPNSFFDPKKGVISDDCFYGSKTVAPIPSAQRKG